jgi:hypothetical protein
VRGLDLRYALLVVLDTHRGRDLSVPELVAQLGVLGVRPRSANPGKDVADALRWEVRRGRVIRTGWGRYQLGRLPRTTRWRAYDCVTSVVESAGRRADDADLGDRPWWERG